MTENENLTIQSLKAEIEMLRGVGCSEDGDGPCGVCLKCAYQRGAERMRQAAMGAAWHSAAMGVHNKIRDLTVPTVTDSVAESVTTGTDGRVKELERELDAARNESKRLRQIVSSCAAAIGNGSFASPECSLEFMSKIPAEITAEIWAAYRRGAVDMRESAAVSILPLMTSTIKNLPIPKGNP